MQPRYKRYMPDPSTLLLLAYSHCKNATASLNYSHSSICMPTEKLNQAPGQWKPPNSISAPEAIAFAQNSRFSNLKTVQGRYSEEIALPPTVRLGSQGEVVTRLQTILQQLGYYQQPVDGVYGSNTFAAVSTFQQALGLNADGIVGPITWITLQQLHSEFLSAQERELIEISPNQPETRGELQDTIIDNFISTAESPLANQSVSSTPLNALSNKPLYLWLFGWAVVSLGGWGVIVLQINYHRLPIRLRIGKSSTKTGQPDNIVPIEDSESNIYSMDDLLTTISESEIDQSSTPETVSETDAIEETVEQNNQDLSLGKYGLLLFTSPVATSPNSLPIQVEDSKENTAKLNLAKSSTLFLPLDQIKFKQSPPSIGEENLSFSAVLESPAEGLYSFTHPSISSVIQELTNSDLVEVEAAKGRIQPLNNFFTDLYRLAQNASLANQNHHQDTSTSQENVRRTAQKSDQADQPIPEQMKPGTVVGILSPTNPKTGERYTYSLIDDAGGRFMLTENKLALTEQSLMNFKTDTSHTVIVRRTDSKGIYVDKSFTLRLKAENESAPPQPPVESQKKVSTETRSLTSVSS
ncbi:MULTISPECIES: peptidoglycan-binding domain-containing protein [Moorena]|uniref:peptidoglycan-binding domain-containing protein n=1 Tax=Moorena TaxID=1155738 RepID=UPI0010551631|nr:MULTISPECIES: peptidoglycan-binding domain-containing protein [Moorena]NES41776.1 peptidoglycan-binding protein [Moorena sp. SIO2C4]